MLTSFDKAIIAFLLSVLGVVAYKLPILADPAVQNGIIAIATPLVVALGAYLVPNKAPDRPLPVTAEAMGTMGQNR